jgi:hypothetical protein
MNYILFYFILLSIINLIDAKANIVSVSVCIYSSNDTADITRVINEKEKNGYKLLNYDALNSETYLYVRLEEHIITLIEKENATTRDILNIKKLNDNDNINLINKVLIDNAMQIFYMSFMIIVIIYVTHMLILTSLV